LDIKTNLEREQNKNKKLLIEIEKLKAEGAMDLKYRESLKVEIRELKSQVSDLEREK